MCPQNTRNVAKYIGSAPYTIIIVKLEEFRLKFQKFKQFKVPYVNIWNSHGKTIKCYRHVIDFLEFVHFSQQQ